VGVPNNVLYGSVHVHVGRSPTDAYLPPVLLHSAPRSDETRCLDPNKRFRVMNFTHSAFQSRSNGWNRGTWKVCLLNVRPEEGRAR
jgi:hypothetical protein